MICSPQFLPNSGKFSDAGFGGGMLYQALTDVLRRVLRLLELTGWLMGKTCKSADALQECLE